MRWSGQMNESDENTSLNFEWRGGGGVGKYTSARSKEIGFAIFVEVFTVVAPRHQQSYKSALPTLSLWANSDQTKYSSDKVCAETFNLSYLQFTTTSCTLVGTLDFNNDNDWNTNTNQKDCCI